MTKFLTTPHPTLSPWGRGGRLGSKFCILVIRPATCPGWGTIQKFITFPGSAAIVAESFKLFRASNFVLRIYDLLPSRP